MAHLKKNHQRQCYNFFPSCNIFGNTLAILGTLQDNHHEIEHIAIPARKSCSRLICIWTVMLIFRRVTFVSLPQLIRIFLHQIRIKLVIFLVFEALCDCDHMVSQPLVANPGDVVGDPGGLSTSPGGDRRRSMPQALVV